MSDEKKPEEKLPADATTPSEASSGEIIERKEDAQGLTMEQVLQHPMVREMAVRLETLQRTFERLEEKLPGAISRAITAAQEAQRPKGMDISNPELLSGGAPGKGIPVQDLRAELSKTRKDVGYKKASAPEKLKNEKK